MDIKIVHYLAKVFFHCCFRKVSGCFAIDIIYIYMEREK